jgi:RNA polymerase sigma factor (sigma-70 family)
MDRVQEDTQRLEPRVAGVCALSDRELVAEVLRKDRKATAEFVSRYADHVYGYVRRRLVPRIDLVDDLVQEIFLAAWQNLGHFRGESSLGNWLLGIARHKVDDHYRSRLRELQMEEEDDPSDEALATHDDLGATLDAREAGEVAREILADLPEIYAFILRWRYWEKKRLREIAAETGKTEKAIERLLARARGLFKKRWNERQSATRR